MREVIFSKGTKTQKFIHDFIDVTAVTTVL